MIEVLEEANRMFLTRLYRFPVKAVTLPQPQSIKPLLKRHRGRGFWNMKKRGKETYRIPASRKSPPATKIDNAARSDLNVRQIIALSLERDRQIDADWRESDDD